MEKLSSHASIPSQAQAGARYSSATLEVWSPTRREYLPVSGTLDSGTRQNWISAEVAHRIRVQRFERIQSDVLLDFQSRPFQASRRLQLTWRGSKSRQTRESWFFVIENCPFDILIGGDLLFSQGIYIFNEAALLFFNRPATEGEEQRMQETLENQQQNNERMARRRTETRDTQRRQQRELLDGYRTQSTGSINGSGLPVMTSSPPPQTRATDGYRVAESSEPWRSHPTLSSWGQEQRFSAGEHAIPGATQFPSQGASLGAPSSNYENTSNVNNYYGPVSHYGLAPHTSYNYQGSEPCRDTSVPDGGKEPPDRKEPPNNRRRK